MLLLLLGMNTPGALSSVHSSLLGGRGGGVVVVNTRLRRPHKERIGAGRVLAEEVKSSTKLTREVVAGAVM